MKQFLNAPYIEQIKKHLLPLQKRVNEVPFGSYAAEIAYYMILASIPIFLAISNLIVLLPFTYEEVQNFIRLSLPGQVARTILPFIENYFDSASTSLIPMGLILALWPASNVFNALQRILNKIYQSKNKQNFLIQRLFAYLFTLFIFFVIVVLTFIFVFGEQVLNWLHQQIAWDFTTWLQWIQAGSLFSLLVLLIFLMVIYTYLPNHNYTFTQSFTGAAFSTTAIVLVGKFFGLMVSYNRSLNSNTALGAILVLMFWLYINCLIVFIGAFINAYLNEKKIEGTRSSS